MTHDRCGVDKGFLLCFPGVDFEMRTQICLSSNIYYLVFVLLSTKSGFDSNMISKMFCFDLEHVNSG